MGNFIWHEWARFVAVGASVCECSLRGLSLQMDTDGSSVDTVWAGYWGLFYRKFFWDFVNGTLRDPGGFQYVVTLSPFLNYL